MCTPQIGIKFLFLTRALSNNQSNHSETLLCHRGTDSKYLMAFITRIVPILRLLLFFAGPVIH